jgi:nucleotide-binding universal stress UspA family protein
MATSPIVVGFDGSDGSLAALRWALQEAQLRKSSVHVVHGWLSTAATMDVTGVALGACEDAGRSVLATASELAAAEASGVDVVATPVASAPAQALIEASKNAELLVVGSRGHGGFAGLLLGSVSNQVAHHAHCPVVIVRPEHR